MNPAFDTRILLLLYTLLPGLAGLRLVKVSIPAYKLRGESAFLECQYELNRPAHYLPNNNHNNNNDHDNININSNTNNNRRHQHPHGDLNYVDTDADADAADSDADELPVFGRSRSRARGQGQGQGPGPSQSHLRAYPYNQQQQQQRHYDPDDGVFYPSQQQQQGRSYAFEDSRRRDAYHEELAGGGRRFADDASDSQELEDGGEALYAVKWYKDNEEFYRYVPKAHPPKQSYRIDGIRVIEEHSDSSRVLLRGLTLNSTGLYRCEVSAEAPNFSSVQGEGRMDIVYLPRDGPHIKGQQFQYQIGELLNLNCTSGKSHPASHLQWFINDQPVMDTRFLMRYNDTVHKHGLITSTLGLQLTVDGRHFLNGAMRVKCMASISPVLWRGGKESVLQRRPGIIDNREAMLLVRSSTTGLHARRPQGAVAALLLALALVLRHQLSQLSPATALGAIARTLGSGAIR